MTSWLYEFRIHFENNRILFCFQPLFRFLMQIKNVSFVQSSDFENITHVNYSNPYIALGGRKPFRACFYCAEHKCCKNKQRLFHLQTLQSLLKVRKSKEGERQSVIQGFGWIRLYFYFGQSGTWQRFEEPVRLIEGHLNPGLSNPKLQTWTLQPQTFQPWVARALMGQHSVIL